MQHKALNIARPDIVVDIMEGTDWYESGRLEIVKHHYKVLKPRLGIFWAALLALDR
jgi:hypothetical protein